MSITQEGKLAQKTGIRDRQQIFRTCIKFCIRFCAEVKNKYNCKLDSSTNIHREVYSKPIQIAKQKIKHYLFSRDNDF
jgi:hypothetical protein